MKERIIQVESNERIVLVLPSGERTVLYGPDETSLPVGRVKSNDQIHAQDAVEYGEDISDFM